MAGKFELFVNGFSVGAGGDLGHSYSFFPKITPGRDVVAISGYNVHGPAAFVGTFGGVVTSADDWRCKSFPSHVPENWNSNNFDDSNWSRAVSFGRNNDAGTAFYRKLKGYALGIPGNAKWIWAENNSNHKLVVCRSISLCVCITASAHPRIVQVSPDCIEKLIQMLRAIASSASFNVKAKFRLSFS
jgi:hypothetical protein